MRSAYLRVRLGGAALERPGPDQPPWLGGLVDLLGDARALGGRPRETTGAMSALDALAVSRWLVALVGPAAVEWPVDRLMNLPGNLNPYP